VAADPSLVGRTYPPSAPYEIGREKVREFAEAIGDTNPVHRDRAAAQRAGHPDVLVPPTFAFALATPAMMAAVADPALGLSGSAVIHGEQRFVWERPLRVGDRIVSTATIETLRSSAGRDILGIRVDLVAEPGEQVVTASMMLLFLAAPGGE
jgi:acyl dehydratase